MVTKMNLGAGRGRSKPTGYSEESGEVIAQELVFDNGYKVLAVQVRGQKAVIKGAGPWRDLIENREAVNQVVMHWLTHVEGRHPELISPSEEESTDELPRLSGDRRVAQFNVTSYKRRATDLIHAQRRPLVEGPLLSETTRISVLEKELFRLRSQIDEKRKSSPASGDTHP